MRQAWLLSFVVLAGLPRAAWPQGGNPLGSEFRVNTYTSETQRFPSIASDSSGNFVVAWDSNLQDGSDRGIFGQRYDASGAPLGPEFRVNTYTTSYQGFARVASAASGSFVIVWSSFYPGFFEIFGQRYAASGGPLGPEFRVNTYTTAVQAFPSVASDAAGNFVVVWESLQDGSFRGVFGQRYAASGVPLGPEFRVNTYTTDYQEYADVASDSSGNFVVVWQSGGQDGSSYGVFGQRYAASGAPLGPEFRVNAYTTSFQSRASVASDAIGNFVVSWHSSGQDGAYGGIFAQRYASTGAPLGPEFRVNTYTTDAQYRPSIAADPSGNFVVDWMGFLQDGSSDGVFGQRYASSGAPLGSEFRVNTYTTGSQSGPAVTSDASGNFVVVWQSYLQDGSNLGVFGQRYGLIVPVELMRFTVE